jgi:hypothetical protein
MNEKNKNDPIDHKTQKTNQWLRKKGFKQSKNKSCKGYYDRIS